MHIDLNCDMGESWYDEAIGQDEALMPHISSCNLACGVHGGDPATMEKSILLALQHGVSIGAHPSLPGRENFGREPMDLFESVLFEFLTSQVQTLKETAKRLGAALVHLKPHGALYNLATVNVKEAQVVCRVCREHEIKQIYGPPGSELEKQATEHELTFVAEGFVDRVYQNGLQLRSRKLSNSVIHNSEQAAQQALLLARDGQVVDYHGEKHIHLVKTLCIHGDHREALKNVLAVRAAFELAGVEIKSL